MCSGIDILRNRVLKRSLRIIQRSGKFYQELVVHQLS